MSLQEKTIPFIHFRAFCESDEKLLGELYRKHFGKVKNFVMQNNGDEDEAKDIYQDAFLTVWRNVQLGKFVPENDYSVVAYLLRIAKNKWLDHLRSKQFRNSVPLAGDAHMTQETVTQPDVDAQIELMKSKFQLLGKDCRDLLTWFYFKKKSLQEIADEKGWTAATARNNKYRCLKTFRKLIHQTHD